MSMTENEVFEGIHKDCGSLEICDYKNTGCSDCVIRQTLIKAEEALSEIQQYRAIGTVEELKSMKENGAFTGVELASLACMQMKLKDYHSIGTVEEFKALKEKNEPKKIIKRDTSYKCSICNSWVGYRYRYCDWCGRALDWEN